METNILIIGTISVTQLRNTPTRARCCQ